jgi:hypothetical protein
MLTRIASMPLFGVTIGLLMSVSLGLSYFKMLRSSVLRYCAAPRVSTMLLLQLGRFVLAAATFAMLSFFGAPALLAGLIGFLLIRHFAIRRKGAWL